MMRGTRISRQNQIRFVPVSGRFRFVLLKGLPFSISYRMLSNEQGDKVCPIVCAEGKTGDRENAAFRKVVGNSLCSVLYVLHTNMEAELILCSPFWVD